MERVHVEKLRGLEEHEEELLEHGICVWFRVAHGGL
jgi:hypothetical protein